MFPTFSNLANVVERADGSVVAQCPACAALGRDSKGHHLVVYDNEAFGCIAFPGHSEEARAHRREVARLAGWRAPQRAKGSEGKGAGAPPPVALVPWRSKVATQGATADGADGSVCGSPRPSGSSSSPFLTSRKTNKTPSETSAERTDEDTQPQPEIL